MKKTMIGIALLISSVISYVGIIISAAICGSQLTQWSTDLGKTGTALIENIILLIPFIISVIIFVIGLVILYHEYHAKADN
ncbi:MAG TPA: hypothetical protein VN258_16395 [Mobilitalea sp.]|nr:hypothetical protein [Mobilitalea sp.]